jgi:iron complex transport system substrate-binding protein
MAAQSLRIVSLLPSATEIVTYLGWGDALVGRSHACDFPSHVAELPVCTAPKLSFEASSQNSRVIHDRIGELLQVALSIYAIDTQMLAKLQPTHILTQTQCEVCAASLAEVEKAVASCLLSEPPKIISLQPAKLADLWEEMRQVAIAIDPIGGEKRAEDAIATLQNRLQTCQQRIPNHLTQPTVACLEWTDPLMAAGNWVPELVALAGGHSLFGKAGYHSPWFSWDDLLAADPDVIIAMPCGFDLVECRAAISEIELNSVWSKLTAVQQHRIYLVDGNQYFNRPGPRLIDSLEILAEILHPEDCQYGYALKAWKLF